MNTVDALKKLYKTLAGKDYAGDPNPTDAEMIDAIAKDAQSGGGSGGGAKIIELPSEFDRVSSPHCTIATGLTADDFAGGVIKYQFNGLWTYLNIDAVLDNNPIVIDTGTGSTVTEWNYSPATGYLEIDDGQH